MASEPKDIVLEHLRNLRGDIKDIHKDMLDGQRKLREDIRGVRNVQDKHTLHLDCLEERIETLREATMTAMGFAVDASARENKFEAKLADLTKRVEILEQAK